MEKAVEWYHDRLLNAPDARPAREYLRARGINGDVARAVQARAGRPTSGTALATSLKFTEKVLLSTGLGFVNKRDRRQDALRARLIFPIFDPGGKAVAVGGRILPPPYGPSDATRRPRRGEVQEQPRDVDLLETSDAVRAQLGEGRHH